MITAEVIFKVILVHTTFACLLQLIKYFVAPTSNSRLIRGQGCNLVHFALKFVCLRQDESEVEYITVHWLLTKTAT